MPHSSLWPILTAACFAYSILCFRPSAATGDELPVLQSVGEILSRPKETVRGFPHAHLTGVVTCAEARWGKRIFIQDDTGGILIDGPNPADFAPGDLVEVDGILNAGPYSPIIARAKARKIGQGPLPKAKRVSSGELFTGGEDGQWVEIEGWVRSVWQITPSLVGLNLISGGSRLSVRVSRAEQMPLEGLPGARVRVRGVASVVRTREITREVLEVRLFAASPTDFFVEEQAGGDPMAEPPLSYVAAFQFQRGNSPGRRAHVEGIVTYQSGHTVFLTEDHSGLEARTTQVVKFAPGDRVAAVGFPDVEHFLPVLSDTVLVAKGRTDVGVRPVPSTAASLRSGVQHSNFVAVTAQLIDRTLRPVSTMDGELAPTPAIVLSLQADGGVFEAEIAGSVDEHRLARLETGCVLELRGICLAQPDANGAPAGFKLLIPSEKDLRVVHAAPYFNTRRLLLTLCGMLAGLLLLAGWSVLLTRRNAALTAEVRERTAIAAERSRLARDLHDSLEQSLVGIDMQLAGAELTVDDQLAETHEYLAAARVLVKHSHSELRQSIWNLRSALPEPFDLATALRRVAEALSHGSGISIQVETNGAPAGPPGVLVEENLFRIGQEALTNAIKHSHAQRIAVDLRYEGAHIELTVADDGVGIALETAEKGAEGRFGLLGMRERSQRIGADLRIENLSPQGCRIRAAVSTPETRAILDSASATA